MWRVWVWWGSAKHELPSMEEESFFPSANQVRSHYTPSDEKKELKAHAPTALTPSGAGAGGDKKSNRPLESVRCFKVCVRQALLCRAVLGCAVLCCVVLL